MAISTPALLKLWQPEHKLWLPNAAIVGKIQVAEVPENTFV